MSTAGDLYGLRGCIDNIADTAKGALKSGAVAENEREDLRQAIKTFEVSVAAILKDLPDQSKLNLVSIINSAFTVGRMCGLSETVMSAVTSYGKRLHTAKMRNAKAEKPRQKAINEAITAALKGRRPVSRFSKEATAHLDDVNRWLERRGEKPVLVDVIRRELEKRAAQTPRS
jgi:hypothetical protein